ncbi:sensor histidine kinase [Allokutzneria albata]|uniref:histidine kinase n=1 Tax=Allokutzneria albata TaxID=211114 RepID=A0A1G9V8Y3_ALLAB|nr:histidine kinase [Allokutzneria albata]SDM68553.1 Signal transduction histidine kinase [Allokutzneria albata]
MVDRLRRPREVALWVALAVALVLEVTTVDHAVVRWLELACGGLLLGAAVVFSDRFPVGALCLFVGAAEVPALILAPTVTNLGWAWPFLAASVFGFRVGRRVEDMRPAQFFLAAVVLAGLPVSVLVDGSARGGFGLLFGLYDWFVLVLILLIVVLLPWLAGRYRRQRAELAAAGWERAALLERQQRLEVDQARSRERARIARDMHDSLGHEWGLIALRAAALEVTADLSERQRAAVGELRAGVAEATERLREIIGMLRPDDEPEPDERVDIAGLVERAADAGMDVVCELPEPPVGSLPTAVDRAAHRVVQEGLTNAAKHAPGATVTVRVERGPDSTVVTVASGRATKQPGGVAGRYGLVGLAERVRLLGGTLEAGPRDGGFALVATLPYDAPPADPPAGLNASGDSKSARERARGQARRRLTSAIRVPALTGTVVAVLAMALYALVGANNTLDPAVFERIPLGATRAEVEARVPPFQILGDPERMLPAPPAGAACRHYWASEQRDDQLLFRLCFAADRLVVKEVVPRGAISTGSE